MPKKKLFLVQGLVIDKETGDPVGARLEAKDPETRSTLAAAESSPKDGRYQILIVGKAGEETVEVNLKITSDRHKAFEELIELETEERQMILTRDFSLEASNP